jgi:PAS domain S-box-containing protein
MPFILVADDRPLNRHFLTTLLTYYGHDVGEAADGVEALRMARERKPDLIIADVVMPRMDGPGLARALRAEPQLEDVPLIFYSASYREVEAQAIARAVGVEHVITKPSDPEVILRTVARALGEDVESAPPEVAADPREIIGRLQLANIRMSALIELMVHLSGERDPHELLRTACLATRKIFGADYAVLAAADETHADGDVDRARLELLVSRVHAILGTKPVRADDPSKPLIAAIRDAMPGVASALLVPMRSRGQSHGWLLLANRRDAPPFSLDDERLAVAAAAQIRAESESLRAAEAELATYREDLAALVEASPVPIIAFDRSCIVQVWNAAAERTYGWSAAEVLGRTNPALPPQYDEEFRALARECLGGRMITNVEQRRVRKDGHVLDVYIHMAPLHDGHGRPRGFVSIVSDVTALRASRESLRALSARVLSIQEEERTRLARELHDDLGQLLTAIKLDAARLLQDLARGVKPPRRVVDGLLPLIDSTMETVVRLVSELRPSRIGEMGLAAAIEKKLSEFQRRTEIQVESRISPKTLQVPEPAATAAFRIVEEALTNVARHSGATAVNVTVNGDANVLELVIDDNGRGITDAARTAPDAYGLIGMKERAIILGGSLEVSSGHERGTVVTARIPLRADPGVHR